MSQPDAAVAEWLNQDQNTISQAELDQLFRTTEIDHSILYLVNGETVDDSDFSSSLQTYPTPPDSNASSSVPTPNFTHYNFLEPSTHYPTPGSSTPYPYPIEQQQYFDPSVTTSLPIHQRPRPYRSKTSTSYLGPSPPAPGYTRRRSLSQSDVSRIASLSAQAPNPTFIRLQAPRSRSVTPERRRGAARHSRSSSRKSNCPSRHTQATSVPYFVDGRVVKRLGDPLSPDEALCHCPAVQPHWSMQDGYTGADMEDQVVFRHIVGLEQIKRSQRIIEIGAMASTQHIDPTLEGNGATILRKLEELEHYLMSECASCEVALRGCASIRETIEGSLHMSGVGGSSNSANLANSPDSPSHFIHHETGADGESEMDRLMEANGDQNFNEVCKANTRA